MNARLGVGFLLAVMLAACNDLGTSDGNTGGDWGGEGGQNGEGGEAGAALQGGSNQGGSAGATVARQARGGAGHRSEAGVDGLAAAVCWCG